MVNSHPSLFTTSCCSGRVAITNQPGVANIQKEGLEWVFMSHDPIDDPAHVIDIITNHLTKVSNEDSTLLFKFEGIFKFILNLF